MSSMPICPDCGEERDVKIIDCPRCRGEGCDDPNCYNGETSVALCGDGLRCRPRSDHHCHARGCMVATNPEMLMCLRHWRMVPKQLQREVWRHYRAGQCDDRDVSREWLAAADAAIDAVARSPRGTTPPSGDR